MPGQADQATGAAEGYPRLVALWLAEAVALVAPDAVDHRGGASGDHVGAAAWQDKWEHMHGDLRDVSLTIEHNVAAGDFSVNRYTFRGTPAASGRRVEATGLDMVRV